MIIYHLYHQIRGTRKPPLIWTINENRRYLFVDEAAGIPVFEASTLLRRAKRVIMATTLDGNLDTL